jgi:hypothetical protein
MKPKKKFVKMIKSFARREEDKALKRAIGKFGIPMWYSKDSIYLEIDDGIPLNLARLLKSRGFTKIYFERGNDEYGEPTEFWLDRSEMKYLNE